MRERPLSRTAASLRVGGRKRPNARTRACRRTVRLSAMAKVATVPNDLEPFWMPFTANRSFKRRPRLITGAKDMHYITVDGRRVIDGSAGLWCTNAGHNRDPIVHAIQRQAAELDYAPAFQFSHSKAFELAGRPDHTQRKKQARLSR